MSPAAMAAVLTRSMRPSCAQTPKLKGGWALGCGRESPAAAGRVASIHPPLCLPAPGSAAVLGSGAQADPVGFCCERGVFLGRKGRCGKWSEPCLQLVPPSPFAFVPSCDGFPGLKVAGSDKRSGPPSAPRVGAGRAGLRGAEGILGANRFPAAPRCAASGCVLGPLGPVKSITRAWAGPTGPGSRLWCCAGALTEPLKKR